MSKYILINDKPVHVSNVIEWANWIEKSERTLARSDVNGIIISTVFLGLDHNFSGSKLPVLWETMCFGLEVDQDECRRYTSRDDALCGHQEFVQLAHELPR